MRINNKAGPPRSVPHDCSTDSAGRCVYPKLFVFGLVLTKNDIGEDTEDECGGDAGDGDLTEVEGQTADAGDEDGSNYEEVAVLTQVNDLEHLQTRDGDEAVESDADTADDAGGNGVDELYEGVEEGQGDGHNSGSGDGEDGGIAGDGYTAYTFTVSGVGASAEDGTDDGTDTVTHDGLAQTGILDQVAANDRGEVLVVCDVLRENHEAHGNDEQSQGCNSRGREVLTAFFDGLDKGQLGHAEDVRELETIGEQVSEGCVVHDFEGLNVGQTADQSEDRSKGVGCQNTDDEGNELHTAAALDRCKNGDAESDKTAENCKQAVVIGTDGGVVEVVDGRTREGKTDEGNSGTDDNGGQELVDPICADKVDDDRDEDINEARKYCTDDDAKEAESSGADQRGDEGEGAAKEDRALAAGDEQVDQCACARTEESCGLIHYDGALTAVDQNGYQQGCRNDCQQLLQRKDQIRAELRFVVDVVNQFHMNLFLRRKN